jgi:hypothetical protein
MPFEKDEKTRRGFTGVNLLKNGWRRVIDHVDSTPAQMTFAIANLEYLCAETIEEKSTKKLALISLYGARIGYRIPSDIKLSTNELEPMDAMVGDMLKLASKKDI